MKKIAVVIAGLSCFGCQMLQARDVKSPEISTSEVSDTSATDSASTMRLPARIEEQHIVTAAAAGEKMYLEWKGGERKENVSAEDLPRGSDGNGSHIDDLLNGSDNGNVATIPDIECREIIKRIAGRITQGGASAIARKTPIGLVIVSSDPNSDTFAIVGRAGVGGESVQRGVSNTICSTNGEYYEIVFSN